MPSLPFPDGRQNQHPSSCGWYAQGGASTCIGGKAETTYIISLRKKGMSTLIYVH